MLVPVIQIFFLVLCLFGLITATINLVRIRRVAAEARAQVEAMAVRAGYNPQRAPLENGHGRMVPETGVLWRNHIGEYSIEQLRQQTLKEVEHLERMEAQGFGWAAMRRSKAILLRHLSPQQQDDLATKGYFNVVVPHHAPQTADFAGRRLDWGGLYRIYASGKVINETINSGYCVAPRGSMPMYDRALASKCYLEGFLSQWIQHANPTGADTLLLHEQHLGVLSPASVRASRVQSDREPERLQMLEQLQMNAPLFHTLPHQHPAPPPGPTTGHFGNV